MVAPGGGMNTQIWLTHPDGSGARRVTAGGKDNNFLHRFSRDGKLLAYASSLRDPKTTDAILFDVASGQTTRIADLEGRGWIADLSRDGKRALVARMRARGNVDLYVVDARGQGGPESTSPRTKGRRRSTAPPSRRTAAPCTSAATSAATASP